MVIEIKKGDSPEKIDKELKKILDKAAAEKKQHLEKFFGILKLDEDPVTLQRRWRDEW
ncbi:hypothetical protein HQ865_18885 [Mucilaginibacter mali]|uniref:Uncharacterized protein n=1 Tax=Mucilaginibacter mali TaxID=2740462 RepID=A0A7D4QBP2_9SPHI|nr:hypothetical protein [Mucilaginibacter mali]QKJ31745.1 hypothetical protein HQ865_18885 [Mucilaginibacter mali]